MDSSLEMFLLEMASITVALKEVQKPMKPTTPPRLYPILATTEIMQNSKREKRESLSCFRDRDRSTTAISSNLFGMTEPYHSLKENAQRFIHLTGQTQYASRITRLC